MDQLQFADLFDLVQAVKIIRKHSPNTGNIQAFREGIAGLNAADMLALCQAIDTASLAVSAVGRSLVRVDLPIEESPADSTDRFDARLTLAERLHLMKVGEMIRHKGIEIIKMEFDLYRWIGTGVTFRGKVENVVRWFDQYTI